MNPLWYVAAAIIVVSTLPVAAIGLYQRRQHRIERQLSRRKKERIQL